MKLFEVEMIQYGKKWYETQELFYKNRIREKKLKKIRET